MGAVRTGAELEITKSAEIGSKFGAGLGPPPGQLGANMENKLPMHLECHYWKI